jgi:hypothetical protein
MTQQQPSIEEQIAEAERMVEELRKSDRLIEEQEWLGKLARLTAIRDGAGIRPGDSQDVENDDPK